MSISHSGGQGQIPPCASKWRAPLSPRSSINLGKWSRPNAAGGMRVLPIAEVWMSSGVWTASIRRAKCSRGTIGMSASAIKSSSHSDSLARRAASATEVPMPSSAHSLTTTSKPLSRQLGSHGWFPLAEMTQANSKPVLPTDRAIWSPSLWPRNGAASLSRSPNRRELPAARMAIPRRCSAKLGPEIGVLIGFHDLSHGR